MKKEALILVILLLCIKGFSQSIQTCSTCSGSGAVICLNCGGHGSVVMTLFDPYIGYYNQAVLCPICGGYGKVVCPNCGGQGKIMVYGPSFGSKTCGPTTPPNNNSDGYIYQGGETCRYEGRTYNLYKKQGHYYIYDKCEGWIKVNK